MERVAVVDLALIVRAAEGEELLRDEPVEVAVLHALVVLVLVAVKVVKVEEASILRLLKRPEGIRWLELQIKFISYHATFTRKMCSAR